MAVQNSGQYDAVIIGAGIGGLVCGCYLAKAGMKVLIAEQHHKPGGYCTSFKRQGFTFDAGPHCFGSYREGGVTRKILRDLAIDKRLEIMRSDPQDMMITPHYRISFWNDVNKTINGLQETFPKEAGQIVKFLQLILCSDPKSFAALRSVSFKQVLDNYFQDEHLKVILSFPFFGISGLPSYLLSAFVGAKLFSEFLLDGGYYPAGGMQTLPDSLSERFKELGGDIKFSSRVRKIIVREHKACGVVLNSGEVILSGKVVSNCDARQTFLTLIGTEKIEKEFVEELKQMRPSLSNFIIYLGLDRQYSPDLRPGTFYYFARHYDLEKTYKSLLKNDIQGYGGCMLRISQDASTIYSGMPAPYRTKTYWLKNKTEIMETLIEQMDKNILPGISRHILFKDAATPHTLNRYTSNYKGASFGWAGIPAQFAVPGFRKPKFIQDLYLSGHWSTLGVGVSGTAYVGYDTAMMILKEKTIKMLLHAKMQAYE